MTLHLPPRPGPPTASMNPQSNAVSVRKANPYQPPARATVPLLVTPRPLAFAFATETPPAGPMVLTNTPSPPYLIPRPRPDHTLYVAAIFGNYLHSIRSYVSSVW